MLASKNYVVITTIIIYRFFYSYYICELLIVNKHEDLIEKTTTIIIAILHKLFDSLYKHVLDNKLILLKNTFHYITSKEFRHFW